MNRTDHQQPRSRLEYMREYLIITGRLDPRTPLGRVRQMLSPGAQFGDERNGAPFAPRGPERIVQLKYSGSF